MLLLYPFDPGLSFAQLIPVKPVKGQVEQQNEQRFWN
jgi:hypothetical protein